MEAAALTVRSTSQCLAASAPAHGYRRRAAVTAVQSRSPSRAPCGRLRALPPELSEILSPKLVPGSPADTGDVSSLIPVRCHPRHRPCLDTLICAVMLLFYIVSNWVVPELVLKRLQPKAEDAAASSMSSAQQGDAAADGKIRLKAKKKTKKKKSKEETIKV